uniref:Serine protease 29 n=1 Tax=Lygus hesperus TaxID=30085 RepID=A0A0A9WN15_LYGHE
MLNSVRYFLAVMGVAMILELADGSDRVVGFQRAIYIPAKKPFWKYLESFENLCMGILLTPTDVLTTCDCMTEIKGTDQRHPSAQTEEQNGLRVISPSILRIRTNELNGEKAEHINVTEIRIHPRCDGFGGYDYAMVRLKSAVSVPISLTENYFPYSRTNKGIYGLETDGEPECYVSTLLKERREWNDHSPFKYSGISMIPVVVADTEECREFMNFDPNYVRYDWANKICIESTKMVPLCKDDMGVPLICNETLVGIVTANSAFCDWNSSLNIVSSLNGAWQFIDGFIKTGGFQYFKNKAQEVLNSIKGLID